MSTAELKIDIINRITNLKDVHLVEQIQRLLDFEQEEIPYSLSEDQKKRIDDAREEFFQGKVLSEAQANSDIEKWLDEK